ncbi:MAG TPA: 4-hydroxybenzoyl-CoA reductase subunit alpha [Candidatus Xenobia bacterium]|nr:4-hydroxybenzoyl-CoA reductase subunit alpha [Candidatus Xenobia bacterium]
MAEFSVIGKRLPMVDAPEKVTGAGLYTDDLALPGMLVGKILHSPHPHARIRRIDTSKAEALPGVRAVVTGREFPNKYGILPIGHDETAFAVDKVRYIGDNVAGVAAESEEAARQALALIEVDYEILPAWFDAEETMKAESNWIHDEKPHNIEKEYHHNFGDVEAALAAADVVRSERFVCPEVTHAAMEPHSTLATYEGGRVTVWSSTQVPYYLHRTLSNVLAMPMEQIRVIKPLIGGGFGGKSEVCPLEVQAACLARKAGAPVKITYTREEVFYAHRGRPQQIVELTMGATRDGRITAVKARIVQDGGAFCGYGPVTILYSGALLGAMYDIPNLQFDGYRVLTNKPACGAMRGHGTVNTRFAFESLLDMVAEELKIDPVEIRRRNLLKPPCLTVNQLRVTSYGYPECIEKVAARARWTEKKGKLPFGRGMGFAGSHYVSGAANAINRSEMPHTTINLRAEADGTVTLFTGASEIGQGSDTIQVQLVAEELGIDLERVKLVAADTDRTPIDLGSYSSRVTFMAGNACLEAARNLKKKMCEALAKRWGVPVEELESRRGRFYHRNGTGKSMSFEEAAAVSIEEFGALEATGAYSPPKEAQGGKFKGAGVGPSPSYSYSAQAVEVTVDPETGQVKVDRITVAHDCGRALNPITVEGQVIGSVWMGLGQAVQEEMLYNQGRIMNPSMLEYKVPSTLESPPVDCLIVESIDPEGPLGAKEAGEGSLAATIPALANAVYDAVGVRITSLPITPEKILRALREKEKKKAAGNGGAP